jgi:hypothetical protein
MSSAKPERYLSCNECEEWHPPGEMRWFNIEGLVARDEEDRTVRVQYETVAADPAGRPYCARCARQFDHLPRM